MAKRPRGRPKLYEEARRLRISRGITQLEAGDLMERSQAWVSILENGGCTPIEVRNYLERLKALAVRKRRRTPGGQIKAGRLRRRTVRPSDLRGDALAPGFDYAASLPPNEPWTIRAICRTAPDAELAFLFHEEREIHGLVGFHLIAGELKRGVIIRITAEYSDMIAVGLEAFAQGNIASADEDSFVDPVAADDGLLADGVPFAEKRIKEKRVATLKLPRGT